MPGHINLVPMKVKWPVFVLCVGFHGAIGLSPAHGQAQEFEEFSVFGSRFEPLGGLLNPGDGYFYGAARWEETARGGVVYRIAPGQEAESLHEFGFLEDGNQTNHGGSNPSCPLIIGHDGAFYGATDSGGAHARGTIYRISPDGIFSVVRDIELGDGGIGCMIATPGGGLMTSAYDGGVDGAGGLFASGPDGLFQRVGSFQGGPIFPPFTPVPEGSRAPFRSPSTLLVGSDGGIYGLFAAGGLIYPQGQFRFTYGAMFRHKGPGEETILFENPRVGDRAYPQVAVEGGFIGVTGNKLVRISFDGVLTTLATFAEEPSSPHISVVQGDAIYGTSFYGGEHQSGYFFRYTPAEGIAILHQFTRDYYSRQRCLVAGNDGLVYGIAALPRGAEPQSGGDIAEVSAKQASAKRKKKPGIHGTRAFRFKPAGTTANFVPVVKPDVAWLPGKATSGVRAVEVDVLKNDRDPDGNLLTLEGPGEGTDPALATVVDTPRGKRLRVATSEADPAGRLITYRVSDGQGGSATGRLAVKSPITGRFAGQASGGGVAGAPLVITFGKNQSVTASLRLNGRTYAGKGLLDIDETGDLRLKSKGAPAILLHVDLLRVPERRIQALFVVQGTTYAATCTPQSRK